MDFVEALADLSRQLRVKEAEIIALQQKGAQAKTAKGAPLKIQISITIPADVKEEMQRRGDFEKEASAAILRGMGYA
jgi:uncharacterized protein (DUF4415 family)